VLWSCLGSSAGFIARLILLT